MALRVSATMALCLLFSLMAVAHCVPHEAALATDASTAAEVDAVSDREELLLLPYSDDSVVSDAVSGDGEVPGEEEMVEPIAAEPDPDRSGKEELTTEGKQDDEKTKEQIEGDEDEGEEEEKTRKNHGGDKGEKKKRKKHHDCDGKGKKDKKMKKHHQSNDKDEEEEEKMRKKIHRYHHVGKTKTKKLTHHNKNDDSDDEDEQEKKEKRWRKAISRSMFGHGRRSQREEAAKEEVNN